MISEPESTQIYYNLLTST